MLVATCPVCKTKVSNGNCSCGALSVERSAAKESVYFPGYWLSTDGRRVVIESIGGGGGGLRS